MLEDPTDFDYADPAPTGVDDVAVALLADIARDHTRTRQKVRV
ncbi:hypothetical protein N7U49_42110 [Streptomyces sp. AD2-2]|nr:hypothetical protein N7U49_42110 [Streptomyces sp. AD2-2]